MILAVMLLFGLAVGCTAALAETAAITPEKIEADWLRQDQIRSAPVNWVENVEKPAVTVTVEEDALGGVDGVKNGEWGFHTDIENDPWWQVDLQKSTPLDRVVVYNLCNQYWSHLSAKIVVLLSDDGKTFQQAYQHDGTTFYGHIDNKPLVVKLDGANARYVRLQQPGKNKFHLDEVEIYPVGSKENVALGKPATQSSTSQWSYKHPKIVGAKQRTYAVGQVVERGLKLAESLRQAGVQVEAEERVLREIQSAQPQAAMERESYMKARWAVRRMTMKNPQLDFDSILFVKRALPGFPHMCDQFYGWWSKPGGGIWILKGFKGENPQVRCLTEDWDDGTFIRPDLSYDGKRILFAYCRFYPHVAKMRDKANKENLPEDTFFNIYEMNIDGSGVRQLTRGKYDDFDARYLPDGRIVFLSTRKGLALQCGKESAAATTEDAALPDSYVRCDDSDDWRPVPIYTLHRMDGDGGNLCAISAFENFEWTPSVAADGRVIYARWDYIDRNNNAFMSLWSTNPDGTNSQLVYGNYTKKPHAVFEARAVPNSTKLLFTACAHHSLLGGSLVLLDRTQGTEFERPLTRLTPEVPFPETEGWAETYYASPFPLSEQHYLVAWSDRGLAQWEWKKPKKPEECTDEYLHWWDYRPEPLLRASWKPEQSMGVYLYDAFGNLEPLYRDPNICSLNPIPIRLRKRPPAMPETVAWGGPQEGAFLVQDVYRGLAGVQRGSIARLRVIGMPPKVQPYMNKPVLGVSSEDPGKVVLGTVPVESDGSAHFRVPSGMSIFFQALDTEGLAVQTMRSLTYVQPNQTLACVGCHEHRDTTPSRGGVPLAAMREPSRLEPGPEGSWPLRYDRLVQPVLEKSCVRCHRPGSDDEQAAKYDLTAAKSYDSLISYANKDLRALAFERDRSIVGEMPARSSKLLALLREGEGHYKVRLDADDLDRLATWMDTYAHRIGHFSDEQEAQLRQLRRTLAPLLTRQ